MAYYSGTATSLANLLTALETHAVADGWTLTGNVLSKAGVYFQLQTTATNLSCLGCESNAVANPAPGVVMIGRIYAASGQPTREISFPCNYEVFGFAQELYLVVNYDVDSYQWMAFGKSSVPGLPGQGGWCSAIIGSAIPSATSPAPAPVAYSQSAKDATGINSSYNTTAQMFAASGPYSSIPTYLNSWVNHNLDALGWTYGTYDRMGTNPLAVLQWMQPSGWNSEAVLLPIRDWVQRPSYKSSLIFDAVNARRLRIDNLFPGDILTIGSDRWKIYPWYRKDSSARNGGLGVNHTGTFGWAIRYEGP